MTIVTRTATAVLGICALASLAACGSDTPTATEARTVTATVTSSSEPTSAAVTDDSASDDATDAAGPAQGGGGEPTGSTGTADEACGPGRIDPGTLAAAIAKVPTDLPNYEWVARESNFSTCNDISYVELDTVGATASSPQQLLIFNRAQRFLGTGIKCNAAYQTVTGSTPDSITVRYRYLQGRDISAAPSGSATVTFRWNGTGVVMDGSLPYGVTRGRC